MRNKQLADASGLSDLLVWWNFDLSNVLRVIVSMANY